jgi:hypothetical protein
MVAGPIGPPTRLCRCQISPSKRRRAPSAHRRLHRDTAPIEPPSSRSPQESRRTRACGSGVALDRRVRRARDAKMRSTFLRGSQQVIAAVALASIVLLALAPEARALPAPTIADARSAAQLRPPSVPIVRQQSCPCTLWSDEAVPAVVAYPENQAVELGVSSGLPRPASSAAFASSRARRTGACTWGISGA